MDSRDSSQSLPIASEEVVVPLTFECDTVEDLQRCLRQVIEANSRNIIPVRVSTHFYTGQHATFSVVPARKPGGAPSGSDIPESAVPVLDAVHLEQSKSSAARPMNLTGTFTTSEAITNQPDEDPVLQSGVARSILASIREVDGFGWSLRQKKRTQKHGWQIEYSCQDSRQNRDRKRNSLRRAKMGSVGRGGIPTFDCRGSIVVIFSSSHGKIIVKYAHTPIHRTVASRRERKSGFPTMAKRPSWITPLAEGHLRMTEKIPAHENRTMQSKQSSSLNTENLLCSAYQVNGTVVHAANEEPYQQALSLLSNNSIEVSSLSQEQLRIFENQPPDLHTESVQRFKDYGPANLGIISNHNPNNHITQSFRPCATFPRSGGNPAFLSSYPDPLQAESQPGAQQNGMYNLQLASSAEPQGAKTIRSRTGCLQCRKMRIKCDEAHPTCKRCTKQGYSCEWPNPIRENISKTITKLRPGGPKKSAPTDVQDSPMPEYFVGPEQHG